MRSPLDGRSIGVLTRHGHHAAVGPPQDIRCSMERIAGAIGEGTCAKVSGKGTPPGCRREERLGARARLQTTAPPAGRNLPRASRGSTGGGPGGRSPWGPRSRRNGGAGRQHPRREARGPASKRDRLPLAVGEAGCRAAAAPPARPGGSTAARLQQQRHYVPIYSTSYSRSTKKAVGVARPTARAGTNRRFSGRVSDVIALYGGYAQPSSGGVRGSATSPGGSRVRVPPAHEVPAGGRRPWWRREGDAGAGSSLPDGSRCLTFRSSPVGAG